jgi:hypothetical protein
MSATVTDTLPSGLTAVLARGSGWSCGVRRGGPSPVRARPSLPGSSVITCPGSLQPRGRSSTPRRPRPRPRIRTPQQHRHRNDDHPRREQLADLSILGTADKDPVEAGTPITVDAAGRQRGSRRGGARGGDGHAPPGTRQARASGSGWTFRNTGDGDRVHARRRSPSAPRRPSRSPLLHRTAAGNITNLAEVASTSSTRSSTTTRRPWTRS